MVQFRVHIYLYYHPFACIDHKIIISVCENTCESITKGFNKLEGTLSPSKTVSHVLSFLIQSHIKTDLTKYF